MKVNKQKNASKKIEDPNLSDYFMSKEFLPNKMKWSLNYGLLQLHNRNQSLKNGIR